LNDHTYCCDADLNVCVDGGPPLDKSDFCADFHMRKINRRAKDAQRLGVPLIFTEFGACLDTESCYAEISNSLDAFDSEMVSWAYWMYKGFGDFTTTGGDA